MHVVSFQNNLSCQDTCTIPYFRTATGKRSFSFRGVKLWNSLPQNLKRLENFNGFKIALKEFSMKELYE